MTSSAGRVAGSGGCSSCISRTGSSSRGFLLALFGVYRWLPPKGRPAPYGGPAASFTALFCRCGSRCRRGLCGGLLPYFDGGLSGFRLGNTRPTGFLGSFGGALLRFGIRNASVLREIQNFFDKVLFFHHKVRDSQCLTYFTQFSQTLAFKCFKVLHICPNKMLDILSG